MKDFRLLPVIPIVAAVFFAIAPPQITARFYSIFDMQDPTSRDRVAMLRAGVAMVKAHPLTGVGPTMVQPLYERYRDPSAVEKVNPHLHNVPVQIAAERGLPALAAWLCGGPRARRRVEWYLASGRAVRPRLRGADLLALGVPRGPRVGEALGMLRRRRLDGDLGSLAEERDLVKEWLTSGKEA